MYIRVNKFTSLIFVSNVNSIVNNILYYHLYCPRIKYKNLLVNQKIGKKDALYGGWIEESKISKIYSKLPRKLKKKYEK